MPNNDWLQIKKNENLEKVRKFYLNNPGAKKLQCCQATRLSDKTVYSHIRTITSEMLESGKTIQDCAEMFSNVKSSMEREARAYKAVKQYYYGNPGKTLKECHKAIGVSKRSVRRAVESLRKEAVLAGQAVENIDNKYPVLDKKKRYIPKIKQEKFIPGDTVSHAGKFSMACIFEYMGWSDKANKLTDSRGFCKENGVA